MRYADDRANTDGRYGLSFFFEALHAFSEHFDTDPSLGDLRLAEPYFGERQAGIGLLAASGQVVEVAVDGTERTMKAGVFTKDERETVDVVAATRVLGMEPRAGERLIAHAEQSLRAGIAAWDAALVALKERERQLEVNTNGLFAGLERISATFEQVSLFDDDESTYGIGLYLLSPLRHRRSRFVIDGQYEVPDSSNYYRVPSTWTWRVEREVRQPDQGYHWVTDRKGQTPSDRFPELLDLAESWARRINFIETRVESLRSTVVIPRAARRQL